MQSGSLMKNFGTGVEPIKKISELEAVNLTEWLIFKIKVIYGRPIFEGDNPDEARAIRQEWQDLTAKLGRNGVLATIDYLLSGHQTVPSYPPSPVEFKKCYRIHVASSISTTDAIKQHNQIAKQIKTQNGEGYKQFQELLIKLNPGYLKNDKKENRE